MLRPLRLLVLLFVFFIGKRILPIVLCVAADSNTTSDQTCFHFQISWRVAWVALPDAPNQRLCCETTQQLKQHTRCFLLQLQHNGFNYSKTTAVQITPALIFSFCVLDSDQHRR